MILRIHGAEGGRAWLNPDSTVPNSDGGVVLDLQPRSAGSIELIDPTTCATVARADLPQTGPGVLVTYWQTYGADNAGDLRWELQADVDTMLEEPSPAIPSTTQCLAGA